ncbi:MAG: TIGR04149 family rSAM-modified RiPP [Bacteroidaceae bacterium]|nr:TIGR04149 family rSAM-modified RiPP [Bacteroidaceae bacterium]
MRKLKRFTLTQGSRLSSEEMEMLVGGDFFPFECTKEGTPCAVGVDGGFYTGTCCVKYVQIEGGDTEDTSDDRYKAEFYCKRN